MDLRVIFDSNIWISFAIGKRLNDLKVALTHQRVEVFVCGKLLWEVSGTILKPKLAKYISLDRRQILSDLMNACHYVEINEQISKSRDPNDDFLLDLATKIKADYLITGDNDLLTLRSYQNTKIVSFPAFMAILDTMN